MEKKSVMSIIAVVFMLVLIALGISTYSYWLSDYAQSLEVKTQLSTQDMVTIEEIYALDFYFINRGNAVLNVNEVKIDGIKCADGGNFSRGLNSIEIPICTGTLESGIHEIVMYTDQGIYSEDFYFNSLGFDVYGNPYIIGDSKPGLDKGCEELQKMFEDLDGDYYLVQDIACEDSKNWNGGTGFLPIGEVATPFTGTLDGRGHTIYNLYTNQTDKETGMFGNLNGATISNLKFDLLSVTGQKKSSGALAGFAQNSVIKQITVLGDITGDMKSVGGIVGEMQNSVLSESSYSNGTVTGDKKSVGGLVGFLDNSEIHNSYSTGDVVGNKDNSGGLVGEDKDAIINNSYSTGAVSTGTGNVGGLVGATLASSYYNSFWDTQTSGTGMSAGGSGRTTVQMMQQATFTGWDFTNTWIINDGVSYPTLR